MRAAALPLGRAAAALLLLAAPLASLHAQERGLRLEADGRAMTVEPHAAHGYPAYPLDALRHFGAAVAETAVGAVAVLFGDTLRFESHSPFFRAAERVQQLALPAYRLDGRLHVPAQLFTEWLPRRYARRLAYRDGTLRSPGDGAASAPDGSAASEEPAARNGSGTEARAVEGPVTRVVVLDAGHGGRDPGKVGPGGIREKDVTLAVARRLAAELERRGGYEVHLTRAADTLVALADRPRLANRWRAGRPLALFVSIHANAHRSVSVHGFETYFLSEARTEDERRVAEMENEAVRFEREEPGEEVSELTLIANTLRNDFYQRASNDLAEVVQRNLAGFHPGPNRGVKQAGFRVLVGAFMPAVLVELAFISHRDEARLLGSSAFQDKLSWSIANAVDEFFDGHEERWLTGEAP